MPQRAMHAVEININAENYTASDNTCNENISFHSKSLKYNENYAEITVITFGCI